MEPPHPPQTADVSRIHPIEHISHLLSASTTGIGKTLEDLLDIQENNYQEPGFGEYELKASRSNSNSMLTLFTKSPLPKGANEEFYYHSAYICDGFSYEGLMELIKEGKVFVDLRIGQYPDGRTHDHGTGFRIRECDQDALFNKHQIV